MREPIVYSNTLLPGEKIDLAGHIARRQRGAIANRDGRDFETIFALYRILDIAAEIFDSGESVDANDRRDVTEYPPVLVDDLRTRDREGTTYYQLKHGRVGKKVILRDFARQRALDEQNDIVASYHLVVDQQSREEAAARWRERSEIYFECYVFEFSLGFMRMSQLHPGMRRWMEVLTGSTSMVIWSLVFDLAHSKWRIETDCYVVRFIREMAAQTTFLASPLMSRDLVSAVDAFEILVAPIGLTLEFSGRKVLLRLASKIFLQLDCCVPAVFHRYNEWHCQQAEISPQDVRLKLLELVCSTNL